MEGCSFTTANRVAQDDNQFFAWDKRTCEDARTYTDQKRQ